MISKIMYQLLFFAVVFAITVSAEKSESRTTDSTDCSTVLCKFPECAPGGKLEVPEGECCPECVPGELDCSAVSCLLPDCDKGEKLVVPEGECCPECVPQSTTTLPELPDCSVVLCLRPDCQEDEKLVVPEGQCCPKCQPIQECEIEGQIPSTCASLCPRTCDGSGPIFCPAVCVVGCVCPPEKPVIDTVNKRCVSLDECPTDPCALVDCTPNSVCKVDPGTGTAFCEPSCELNNGGCRDDQLCKLNQVQCITTPCPPEIVCVDFEEVCSQDPDPGPCEALFRKFFYNSTTDQCELFIYGGCEGNDNRFDTRSECISSCGADDPCIGVSCDRGSSCKVDDETGEAFCEPSCELDNGGCLDNQTCELQTVQCVHAPCPPVVNCIDINPCATVLCPDGHQCEVFEPTQEAFCTPNCSLNNGGCRKDQVCELQTVQCIRAPCPPVVNCIDRDPCATVRCANGYRCKVYKPTEEAFCDPDCSLNNGGCSEDQDCQLQDVECVREPCPPVIQCVDRTDCPPTCSREFCSQNRRAKCSNPGPREIPGCTGSCQVTYCRACYSSDEPRPHPEQCSGCENVEDYLRDSRCFRRWAVCVRRSQPMHRGQDYDEEFRCHNPPCPFRG